MQYHCAATGMTLQTVIPQFQIVNGGTSTVPMSQLTLRYYFTSEGGASQGFQCDFAMVNCNNVTGTFGSLIATNTDHYLELGFTAGAGSLGPGANSGPIEVEFHDNPYITMTQTNDYSFDATHTTFTDSTKITLYQNGIRIWGTEPQ